MSLILDVPADPRSRLEGGDDDGNQQRKGFRHGAVKSRSQFKTPNGNSVKRNDATGRVMDQETGGGDFKGVRHEK